MPRVLENPRFQLMVRGADLTSRDLLMTYGCCMPGFLCVSQAFRCSGRKAVSTECPVLGPSPQGWLLCICLPFVGPSSAQTPI